MTRSILIDGGDKMGAEEGQKPGPKPGHGASSVGHLVVGGEDFEGTPGDELPKRPGEENEGEKGQATPAFWLFVPILGIAGGGGVPTQSYVQLDDAHLAFGVLPLVACILTLIWMCFDDSRGSLAHRFPCLMRFRR